MSRHLVTTYDGPFLCNNGRDGIWTYDPAHATCVKCLRAALLAASPRETAPAAAPAACGPHGHSFTDCNERFLAEQAAAAPHNPQSNRSTNNEE